ncbi:unnamed protein product [Phytophthora fragariaefolia]|uniref:Unnamed protein product n=1 Tax=Phytophthora fragariaefolia TaxID=1490495 RepID=A0A9W6TML4_9STRA|nr:unnamed protein product [Phytophthora fragariaefolia]
MTPFETFWGRKPALKLLKIFGQRCVVLIPPNQISTLHQFRRKGRSGVFIGTDPQQKGYFVYISGRDHRVGHSRSVVFLAPQAHVIMNPAPEDDPLRIIEESELAVDDDEENETAPKNDVVTTSDQRPLNIQKLSSKGLVEYPSNATSLDRRDIIQEGRNSIIPLRRSARISSQSISVALSAAQVSLAKGYVNL